MRTPWVRCLLVTALVVGYGIFIGINYAPIAAGADSGGYLGSAKLLSQGRLTTPARMLPEFSAQDFWVHTPLGYQMIPGEETLRPTYPVGLPLHYTAASLVAGWYWGPLLVSVLAALVAVSCCYLCATELGVRPVLAAAGAVALAVSPLLLVSSFTPLSEVVATAWCTAAFLSALRSSRGRGWVLASGAAFSVAVLVRPANVIFLPVLVLALWQWRNLLWAALGAVPGAVGNGIYNQLMWGSPFLSGYGSVVGAFKANYFLPSLTNYGVTLPKALPLIFVGLVLLPLLPWRKRPRELGACLLWAIIFTTFYGFYEFTSTTWWFLRFLLPAFPAMVILSVSGLEAVVERVPEFRRRMVGVVLALLVIAVSVKTSMYMARKDHYLRMKEYQEPYVRGCDWAKANMPAGSLVACMQVSSAFYYYTDFPILRWDLVEASAFADLKLGLSKSGRSFYAVLFPFEAENAFKTRLLGRWTKVADLQGIGIWKFDSNSD